MVASFRSRSHSRKLLKPRKDSRSFLHASLIEIWSSGNALTATSSIGRYFPYSVVHYTMFMFYYIISPSMHPPLCICREPNTTMQFRSFCQSAILVTEQCKLGMCCKRRRFHHLPWLEESTKLLSVWDFEQPVMRQAFVGLICITSCCK
jgi:hypothetical protein